MTSNSSHQDGLFARNGWLRPEALECTAFKALQRAACWSADTRWDSMRTPHVFMGLLSAPDRRVREWCRMLGSDPDSLLLQFATLFSQASAAQARTVHLHREFLSDNALRVLRAAEERAQRGSRTAIRVSDLLIALFSSVGIVADCFADAGYPPERLAALAVAAEEQIP